MGPMAPNYSVISQMVSGFVIGRAYNLSLYLTNSASSDCSFVVKIGVAILLNSINTAYAPWTHLSWTFTATNSSHELALSGYNSL